jgi:cytosine/adenosine deaminase-related metal-dependent hydrolase
VSTHDLVVRDAYLADRDAVRDVAVRGDEIAAVGRVAGDGTTEIDADGDLVSPGLVDAHVHYEMAFGAGDGRRPAHNDEPFDRETAMARTADWFADATPETVAATVRRAVGRALVNGVCHARTHAYVDGTTGATVPRGVLAARRSLADLLDLEVVAFPQQGVIRDPGSAAAVAEAVDAGADLVGGLDPATVDGDRDAALSTWFDLATDLGVGLDAHVHERGATGLATLTALADRATERGLDGRVTASHAYGLADAPAGGHDLDGVLGALAAADAGLVTCYMSTPPAFPLAPAERRGLTVAHGTDQLSDPWSPHGDADPVAGATVESLKLAGRGRDYGSNPGLRALWALITERSAALLGIDGHGIEPGTPANLVVHGAPSPEWVVVRGPTPRRVVSGGRVVARDGRLVDDVAARLGLDGREPSPDG